MAFAVEEIPPFMMAGSRFVIASLLMFTLFVLFERGEIPNLSEVKHSAIAGILFLSLGNGAVTWALQFLDTGITAMIISAQPLVLVLMMWFWDKIPINRKSIIGIILGILGIYLLVSQKEILRNEMQELGIVIIFLCILVWGYASLYVTKVKMPKSLMLNSGIQMFIGGVLLIITSLLFEQQDFSWFGLRQSTWISMLYLIIFGSVFAFSSFNYLLKHVSPEKVSTSTYINPIVALILGYYFRDEIISNQSILASIILLTGVYFINANRHKKTSKI